MSKAEEKEKSEDKTQSKTEAGDESTDRIGPKQIPSFLSQTQKGVNVMKTRLLVTMKTHSNLRSHCKNQVSKFELQKISSQLEP